MDPLLLRVDDLVAPLVVTFIVTRLRAKVGLRSPTGRRKRAGKRPFRARTPLLGPLVGVLAWRREGGVMARQRSQGKTRFMLRSVDGLHPGTPAPLAERTGPLKRAAGGRFEAGEGAKADGAAGGRAAAMNRQARRAIARRFRIPKEMAALTENEAFAPYAAAVDGWVVDFCEQLRRVYGAGHIGIDTVDVATAAGWLRAYWMYYLHLPTRLRHSVDAEVDTSGERLGTRFTPRTVLVALATRLIGEFKLLLNAARDLASVDAETLSKVQPPTEEQTWAALGGDDDDEGEPGEASA